MAKWMTALLAVFVLLPAAASAGQDGTASVPRMSLADMKKNLDSGHVLVIDVRDAASYANGHIPGAVSMPLSEVTRRAAELKTSKKTVVAYCAWPAEQTSARAALDLAKAGVPGAKALQGGIGGWINAGYPLAKGK